VGGQNSRKQEPVAGQYAGLVSLEELLNMQTGYCRGFLQILEEEKQALIDMDMPRLISITAKKEFQLGRLTHLDKMAREKVVEIGNTLGQEKLKNCLPCLAFLLKTTAQLSIVIFAPWLVCARKFTTEILSTGSSPWIR